MNPTPENDEQSAFEAWLSSTEPSGDAESVRRQWEQSHEYRALFESEKNDTPLTDAAKTSHLMFASNGDITSIEVVPYDFARELERDRKRLREACERLRSTIEAITDIGIYPKAIIGCEDGYEERTEYMNGWNAAMTRVVEIPGELHGAYNFEAEVVQQSLALDAKLSKETK